MGWNEIAGFRTLKETAGNFGFIDEDGERVIFSTAHIGAIEAFDTHYLTDDDLKNIIESKEEQT